MLKIRKLTLWNSRGVDNTLGDSLSHLSFRSDELWESEALEIKPRDRHKVSATNNVRTFVLDVCRRPRFRIIYGKISTKKALPELHQHSPHNDFRVKWLWGFMEDCNITLAAPTTDSDSAWQELTSSSRITFFSDTSWTLNDVAFTWEIRFIIH